MCIKHLTLAIALSLALTSAAQAGLVVVGHPSASALTKEQVAEIYLGKNLSPAPIDLPLSAVQRAEFYTKVTGRDAAQIRATWSRITFSGKGQPPKEVPDVAAVKKAVVADPRALGYIDKDAVDSSVKVLFALD